MVSLEALRLEFCSRAQQEFVLDEQSPSILLSGAFGAGKTRGLCIKALLRMAASPGCFVGVFRQTQRSIKHTTLRTFLEIVPREMVAEHNRTDNLVTLVNGSQAIFLGLEEPDRVGSLELDDAYVDEAREINADAWIMVEGRVGRGPGRVRGQVNAATNPDTPSHHLHQRFFVERRGRVVQTRTLENRLLPEGSRARLSEFQGPYRERYVEGKWVGFEGLVYEGFDPLVHVIDPFPVPPEWPRVRAVDFGYDHPFVCLWAALDPDGRLVVYREVYFSHRLVAEHARQILGLSVLPSANGPVPEPVEATWADHDAEGRANLEEHGVGTWPAEKAVLEGIQEVASRLEVQPDGRPRLVFFRDLLVERDPRLSAAGRPCSILEEFASYSWHRGPDGRSVKERPVKVNDDGCLDPRTRVLTTSGWRSLRDLGAPRIERRSRMVELVWRGGNARCTPGHRWLTLRGWVAAQDLTPCDYLILSGTYGPHEAFPDDSGIPWPEVLPVRWSVLPELGLEARAAPRESLGAPPRIAPALAPCPPCERRPIRQRHRELGPDAEERALAAPHDPGAESDGGEKHRSDCGSCSESLASLPGRPPLAPAARQAGLARSSCPSCLVRRMWFPLPHETSPESFLLEYLQDARVLAKTPRARPRLARVLSARRGPISETADLYVPGWHAYAVEGGAISSNCDAVRYLCMGVRSFSGSAPLAFA